MKYVLLNEICARFLFLIMIFFIKYGMPYEYTDMYYLCMMDIYFKHIVYNGQWHMEFWHIWILNDTTSSPFY